MPSYSNRRWFMIALVFLATMINYLDRQTLSVAAPCFARTIPYEHRLTAQVLFAFMLAYTIMNGCLGPLIDRLGTRLGYASVHCVVVGGGDARMLRHGAR